jgi:hypothetical protein
MLDSHRDLLPQISRVVLWGTWVFYDELSVGNVGQTTTDIWIEYNLELTS